VRGWDQNGSLRDWQGGGGLDLTGSGYEPVAGCCEYGDEPSVSCATELVNINSIYTFNSSWDMKACGQFSYTSDINVLFHK
jgi:hypothetical protein